MNDSSSAPPEDFHSFLSWLKDKTESAYNRAAHMPRRRELAQAWADLLLADLPEPGTLMAGRRRG